MKQEPSNIESQSGKPGSDACKSNRWEPHLELALRDSWKRYREAFKRARRRLSADAVHELRVETRRILSLLNLIEPLVGQRTVSPARRRFKKTLKSLAELRDTQVQSMAFAREFRGHPHACALRHVLQRREEKLMRHARRRFRDTAAGELKEVFDPVKKEARRCLRLETDDARSPAAVVGAVDKAFAETLDRRRGIDPADVSTFHRLRVAFKRFRYMLEALREMLPGRFTDHRRAMRAYQTRLGEIQDARLLLDHLDKLRVKARLPDGAIVKLREELTRRQQRLIEEFLQPNDPLRNFWPPRGGIAKLVATDNTGTRS